MDIENNIKECVKMTLLDLESKIKKIYYETSKIEASIKQEYEKYLNPDAANIYAQKLIDNKLAECKEKIQAYRNAQKNNIELEYKNVIEDLKPKQDIISSLEYQTRLSNTLNLLNLSKGNIDTSQLQYMFDAGDDETLNTIKDAYKDNTILSKYIEENSIAAKIEYAKQVRDTGKRALEFENDGYMQRLARWDIENKFGIEE